MLVLASLLLLSSVVGIQGLPRKSSGDKAPPYLELAEKIAEEFMKRQGEGGNDVDERTLSKAERMMDAYNRMSDETRDFYDQSQKREIELDTLALLFDRLNAMKVRKPAKIRNRYNRVPHLTQDITWESDKTQLNITHKRAKRLALSQKVTTRQQWTDAKA